jgi:hypothetical protein
MPTIRKILTGVLLTLFFGSVAAAGQSTDISEKASLQAAMQQYINRNLVDDAYLHLDLATGEVQRLRPVTAHPIILRMGEYFVLCGDFRDAEGNDVNVDFFLARQGNSYVVFHSLVGDREKLQALIKMGKVTRL